MPDQISAASRVLASSLITDATHRAQGLIPGESNATLAVMARHQLVGWGWQQGMYDIPCSTSTAEQCAKDAVEVQCRVSSRVHTAAS